MSSLTDLITDAQRATQRATGAATALMNDPVGASLQEASFWTSLTPKVGVTAADLRRMVSGQAASKPKDPKAGVVTESYLRLLKPTVHVASPIFGTYDWAPYGKPAQDQWKKTLTTIGLSTAAFLVGYTIVVYNVGRKKGRKEA